MNQQPQVGGRYELGELLGRGGMAEVRKGYDVRLGRTVAVKRLRTDLASDSTFQARFRREAQSSASLNHPKIVAVYDTGEELATDGSDVAQPYIVMEYVAGRTLRDILREGRKILPERALEIVAGVCEALDYSHRAGIIHRDIKPGNVMLTPSGDVKVMDFGIARAVADATSNMTQTAAVVGTAQYLSPEQARGETVDSRSDVYSAGCVLYELLTGQPPFSGDSPVSVAYQHVREQAPPPSTIEPDLPPEIDAIVMKALAKPLDQRYQSAAAMKADIDRFLAGQQVQAPPVVPAQSPSDGTPTAVAGAQHTAVFTPVDQEDDEDDRRTVWWVLLGLALAALLVLGVLFGPKLFSGPAQVRVPDVVGEKQAAAEQAIDEAGLAVGEVELQTSELVPRGTVISQDPEEGDFADEGAVVDLVVSAGKEPRTVPYLIGEPREDAAAELRQLDLKPRFRTIESEEPKGIVVEMDPVPSTPVPAGSTVVLVVSEGPRQVPSVIGKTEERAIAILEDAGYDVNVVEDASTPSKPGTVLDQSPGAFQNAPRGSTVTITVSRYEEPEPEPSPTPSPSVEPSPTEPTPTP